MFQTQEKSTGTSYSVTIALLLAAFVFIPLVLIATRPFGYLSLSVALICGALCTAVAWFEWRKNSDLTILSVVPAIKHARGN